MNRPLATILLVLIILGLVFSIYASSQGRFAEALLIYPVLIVIYVFSQFGKKKGE